MDTKKFRVTFEFESVPYNKDTFELCGDNYMDEYPDTVFANEDVGNLFRYALHGVLDMQMLVLKDKGNDNSPEYKRYQKLIKLFREMENSVKVESIN